MKFDGKHYIAHRQWDVTQQFVRADRAGIPAATNGSLVLNSVAWYTIRYHTKYHSYVHIYIYYI
jgi:hypothetical protein